MSLLLRSGRLLSVSLLACLPLSASMAVPAQRSNHRGASLLTATASNSMRRTGHLMCLLGLGKLPDEVVSNLEVVSPSTEPKDVVPLWREMRKCYQTEAEAIVAAKKYPLVILPFMNTADNIRFCWRVLYELGFSDEERREIVIKNPGVGSRAATRDLLPALHSPVLANLS